MAFGLRCCCCVPFVCPVFVSSFQFTFTHTRACLLAAWFFSPKLIEIRIPVKFLTTKNPEVLFFFWFTSLVLSFCVLSFATSREISWKPKFGKFTRDRDLVMVRRCSARACGALIFTPTIPMPSPVRAFLVSVGFFWFALSVFLICSASQVGCFRFFSLGPVCVHFFPFALCASSLPYFCF